MTSRDRLLAVLAPELVEAIEELVSDRVRQQLDAVTGGDATPWLSLDEAANYLRVSPRTLEEGWASVPE